MRYKVIGDFIEFHSGLLELDDGQSKPRIHNLRKINDSTFEVMRKVQFKRGEIIGYDGELNKYMLGLLEVVEDVEEKPKTRAKAKDK